MMITNKLLIEEVEELKNLLSQGKTEIPSFWKCLWPGVVLVAWNMLCAVISVDAVYLTGKYIFHVFGFSCRGQYHYAPRYCQFTLSLFVSS